MKIRTKCEARPYISIRRILAVRARAATWALITDAQKRETAEVRQIVIILLSEMREWFTRYSEQQIREMRASKTPASDELVDTCLCLEQILRTINK